MKTTIILGLFLLCCRLASSSPLPRPQPRLGVAPLQARLPWLKLYQSDQIVTCELGDLLDDKEDKETVIMVGVDGNLKTDWMKRGGTDARIRLLRLPSSQEVALLSPETCLR